jgi:hypothetical protein
MGVATISNLYMGERASMYPPMPFYVVEGIHIRCCCLPRRSIR